MPHIDGRGRVYVYQALRISHPSMPPHAAYLFSLSACLFLWCLRLRYLASLVRGFACPLNSPAYAPSKFVHVRFRDEAIPSLQYINTHFLHGLLVFLPVNFDHHIRNATTSPVLLCLQQAHVSLAATSVSTAVRTHPSSVHRAYRHRSPARAGWEC
jgi:hypothetical protein